MKSLRTLMVLALAVAVAACKEDKKSKPLPPAASAPVAATNGDQTVTELSSVTLSGVSSYDADGDIAGYSWAQSLGPTITLNGANTATAIFTAPDVGDTTSYRFVLTVTDAGGRSDQESVTITVIDLNAAPIADAGPEQTVDALTVVTLTGSATDADPGDSITSYAWTQLSGPTAGTITDANSATATFTAPDVDQPLTLVFELTVLDEAGKAGTDVVEINVEPVADRIGFSTIPTSPLRNAVWSFVRVQVLNAAGARIIAGAAANHRIQLSAELENGDPTPGRLDGVLIHDTVEGLAVFDDLTYDEATAEGAPIYLRATVQGGALDSVRSNAITVIWDSNFPGIVEAPGIRIHDAVTVSDGGGAGVIVVGEFSGTDVDFDLEGGGAGLLTASGTDGFIARYAQNGGDLVWVRQVTGAGSQSVIAIAAAGGSLAIAVNFQPAGASFTTATTPIAVAGNGGSEFAVAELDGSGYATWAAAVASDYDEEAAELAIDSNGNIVVVGQFAGIDVDFNPDAVATALSSSADTDISDAFILKLDTNGAYVWHAVHGTAGVADAAVGVGFHSAGNDVLVGGNFGVDGFILRLTSAAGVGTPMPFGAGSSSSMHVSAVAVDPQNRLVLAGVFTGTVDFDPDATGTHPVTAQGSTGDGFYVSIYPAMTFADGASFQANNLVIEDLVARSGTNAFMLCGSFDTGGDFDPGTGTTPGNEPADRASGFVLSLGAGGTFNWVGIVKPAVAGLDAPVTALAVFSNNVAMIAGNALDAGSVDIDPYYSHVPYVVGAGNEAGFLTKVNDLGRVIP